VSARRPGPEDDKAFARRFLGSLPPAKAGVSVRRTGPFQRKAPALPQPKRPSRAGQWASRKARSTAYRVGPYAGAVSGAAAVGAVAGMPGHFVLFTAGACTMHAGERAMESLWWRRRGGKSAARRRRKYQGMATRADIQKHLSPRAAAHKGARLYPQVPRAMAGMYLGSTILQPAKPVAVSRDESVLVLAPPRSLKSALLSCLAYDAPGALLATSSRADQWRDTANYRAQLGEVLVIDEDHTGPGTNLRWNPVAGCENPKTAIRRAGDMMHASPRDSSGKDAWHEDRGAALLRLCLHAAALVGADLYQVLEWVRDPENPLLAAALELPEAARGWGGRLDALLAQEGDFLSSAVTSAESTLGWMDDPELADIACPPPGEGLDIREFLAEGTGTIYLIGSKKPYGSLTPFFAFFVSEFLEQARRLAEACGGRLPVPLTVVADEAATTCKIDFERWAAVTGGYNITLIAALQALSQLKGGWGENAAETISTLFTTTVISGGFTNTSELESMSKLCGDEDTWHHSDTGERGRKPKIQEKQQVCPPEKIRTLPAFNALVVHRNTRPVQVKVTPIWDRPGYNPVSSRQAEVIDDDFGPVATVIDIKPPEEPPASGLRIA
jgi:type IV secretion system protein VirD4